jgi:hypothetical protein
MAVLLAGTALVACSDGGETGPRGDFAAEAGRGAEGGPVADVSPGTDAVASRGVRSGAALPPGVFEMTRVQIMDPSGFDKPLLAATTLVPAGWRPEGGVVWGPHGQCGNDYGAKWQVVSPDGASALTMLPMPQWQGIRTAYGGGQRNPCPEAFHT